MAHRSLQHVWVRCRRPADHADPGQYSVDWSRHEFVIDGQRYPAQRKIWTIFRMLAAAEGRTVTHQSLFDALYGEDPNGGPLDAAGSIKVRVCHLRRICPWPIYNSHSCGYFIEGAPRPPAPQIERPATVTGIDRRALMAGRA